MFERSRRWVRAARRSEGQGTVEFALVAWIFLLIVFGLVDLGRATMLYNTVATAAHVGARFGAVRNDAYWGANLFERDGNRPGTYSSTATYLDPRFENTIVGQVLRRCPGLDPGQTTVVISGIGTRPQRGQELSVTVSHRFVPVAAGFLGISLFSVQATSTIYME